MKILKNLEEEGVSPVHKRKKLQNFYKNKFGLES